MMLPRRTFLKTGIMGGIMLTLAGGLYRGLHHFPALSPFVLEEKGKQALAAIIGAMLQGAISTTEADMERAVQHTLEAIAGLPLATQKEIQDLFALLTLAPTRHFVAGIPDDWTHAKREDVTKFLQNWRLHRFLMLQSAYHALHDLIIGGWYADETTWASIGYPGPLKELA